MVDLHHKKILWVEDDALLSEVAHQKLAKQKGTFFYAATGKDAINLLKNIDVDAMVLDIHLSDMDGFVLLEQMKDDHTLSHIPVIVLSNDTDKKIIDKCKSYGVKAYFVKVMASIEEVLEELKKHIK